MRRRDHFEADALRRPGSFEGLGFTSLSCHPQAVCLAGLVPWAQPVPGSPAHPVTHAILTVPGSFGDRGTRTEDNSRNKSYIVVACRGAAPVVVMGGRDGVEIRTFCVLVGVGRLASISSGVGANRFGD